MAFKWINFQNPWKSILCSHVFGRTLQWIHKSKRIKKELSIIEIKWTRIQIAKKNSIQRIHIVKYNTLSINESTNERMCKVKSYDEWITIIRVPPKVRVKRGFAFWSFLHPKALFHIKKWVEISFPRSKQNNRRAYDGYCSCIE